MAPHPTFCLFSNLLISWFTICLVRKLSSCIWICSQMQVGGWLKASKTCIQADETHLQTYLHAAPSYLYASKWPIVCFANKLHFSWNTEVTLMNNTCLVFLIINCCSYKDLQLFLNCAGTLLYKSKKFRNAYYHSFYDVKHNLFFLYKT